MKNKIVVYRKVSLGQDGNQGIEYTPVKWCETEEEAKEYVASRTDINGWVDYYISKGHEDGEKEGH